MTEDGTIFKRYPYRVSFNGCDLGILAGMPAIRVSRRCREMRLYDDAGGDEEAAEIVDARATVEVTSCDIATALGLVAAFSVGDNVLADERCGELVLAPPAESGGGTLCFPRAALLPDLEYEPRSDNHRAKLTFRARPDENGTLFSFA
jgi:hypothetical protein